MPPSPHAGFVPIVLPNNPAPRDGQILLGGSPILPVTPNTPAAPGQEGGDRSRAGPCCGAVGEQMSPAKPL